MTTKTAGGDGRTATEWDWDGLVRKLFPRLLAAGRRRFRLSREDCEDALQNVARDLVARKPRARIPEAYVTTAYYRACLKIAATKGAALEELEESKPMVDPRPRLHALRAADEALARVGDRCRRLLQAYILEGKSLAEAAEATGISRNAIWLRVNDCLKRIRKWMT